MSSSNICANASYVEMTRDRCLDERHFVEKKKPDIDPGFKKAMEGFIKTKKKRKI